MKRWVIILVILGVAGIGAAGYLGFRSNQPQVADAPQAPPTTPVTVCTVEQTVDAPGSVVNAHQTQIPMPTTGSLADVLVQPGDAVSAGQVLAHLDNVQQYQQAVAAAQLALVQAQQDRAALDQAAPIQAAQALVAVQTAQTALDQAQAARTALNYPRGDPATIAKLQAQLALAQDSLTRAQTLYTSLSGLSDSDARKASATIALANAQQGVTNAQNNLAWYQATPSASDITAADAALALAQATLAKAQSDYDAIKNGPNALAVSLADAKVADDQATLAAAQKILDSVAIKAPYAGVILAVSASAGTTINQGVALFTLSDPQAVEVESTVTENDYPYVTVGQPASLYFDALPDATLTGKVSRIVPISTGGSSPLYDIYVSIDQAPDKLVEGMSADATISIAQKTGVLCLPRAVVQAAANGTAVVQVWTGSQEAQRTVQVGLRGDTTVEILSGLKEGDLVVTQ